MKLLEPSWLKNHGPTCFDDSKIYLSKQFEALMFRLSVQFLDQVNFVGFYAISFGDQTKKKETPILRFILHLLV